MSQCNNNFRSLPLALEDFRKSAIWLDMLQELTNWENRIKDEIAEPSFDDQSGTQQFDPQMRVMYDEYLRGCLKGIRRAKMLPIIIQEIVEQNQKESGNVEE